MLITLDGLVKKYNMKIVGALHVGAHYGEEVKDYIDHGIKNLCFFEPLSNTLQILEDTLAEYADSANIQIYPYALGNHDCEVEMFVSDHGGMCSSILRPKIVLEQYPGIKFPRKEKVKMVRLDDCEVDPADYNFMNIDVQGYELEVLKGAENLLNNIDYVYTEINVAEVYANAPHVDELDKFLSTYGFSRVETDLSGTTWGDAFYIKEK
jgi:FkbM family methyltransferase